jgi:sugar/nucleoside kinase (ribokinase family)
MHSAMVLTLSAALRTMRRIFLLVWFTALSFVSMIPHNILLYKEISPAVPTEPLQHGDNMQKTIDITAVENALIDLLVHVEDDAIVRNGLDKGIMKLVDQDVQTQLLASVGAQAEVETGGSAANVLRGAAALGAKASYSSAIGDDRNGRLFKERLAALGITDRTRVHPGQATGSCVVLVTPDAERTMNTHLGACREYVPADLPADDIAATQIFFTTGYMWDTPNQIEAVETALVLARRAGAKIALDVADPFAVNRSGDAFRQLMEDGLIDILFANAEEAKMLVDAEGEAAALKIAEQVPLVAVKAGSAGSFVASGGTVHRAEIFPVTAVDSTGAGDMYAGGFLYGVSRGLDPLTCARLGSFLAADNISRIGVRLSVDIREKAAAAIPSARTALGL